MPRPPAPSRLAPRNAQGDRANTACLGPPVAAEVLEVHVFDLRMPCRRFVERVIVEPLSVTLVEATETWL